MVAIPVPVGCITKTAVQVFLKRKVRSGLGERDVALVQSRTDVWGERDGGEAD
jgi:hypothetical protein